MRHIDRQLTEDDLARQRDILRIWSLILDTGDPEVIGNGYRVLASYRGRGHAAIARTVRLQRGRSSIASLVHALAAVQIEPATLRDLLRAETPPVRCPNATCPHYTPAPERGADELAGQTRERHCRVCGTRYVGRRILSTFDFEHGAARPSAKQVGRAQRRLRRWRLALHLACAELLDEGTTISVAAAFSRARVPMNANLRAERLGLVAVVREAARRQRMARGREPMPFMRVSMDDYLSLHRHVLDRDWEGITDWSRPLFQFPTDPSPVQSYREQAAPLRHILEPVFDAQWASSRGTVEDVYRTYDRWERCLSREWLHARTERFARTPRDRARIDAWIDDRTWPKRRERRLPGEPAIKDTADVFGWYAWAYRRPLDLHRRSRRGG